MSGHSKWATIKRKKAAIDAKRGKGFTKLIKEITVSARSGGGDPAGNPHLRLLMEKAKEINMPRENITRAIKRGTGELPGVNYEAVLYEGYGPYGIAVLVEALTDNKNRTVSDMRHTFSKYGGSLAESGAVSWMFKKLGVVRAHIKSLTEDELLEKLIEYEINDITSDDEKNIAVSCEPKSLEHIKRELEDANMHIHSAELEWVSDNMATLTDEQLEKAYEFLNALEEHDDVQNVYANLKIKG